MTGLPAIPGLDFGFKTERLRAKAGKIHNTIKGYGKPFVVRRAGQADCEVIAFMWQAKPGARANAADPGFALLGSEVLFLPDAPVLERGFVLIEPDHPEGPRVFTPDNDVQDIGGQHVALWGHFTPYLEHSRADVLVFKVATGQVAEDPKTGNPVPVLSQQEVTVRLSASADPKVRDMAGADRAAVVFLGRWGSLLEPTGRPPAVDWGDSAPLYVDGQYGLLTIQLAYPDAELATEQAFGGRFVATWQAAPDPQEVQDHD